MKTTELQRAIVASIAPLTRVALQCLESGDHMQLGREAERLIERLGVVLRQLESE